MIRNFAILAVWSWACAAQPVRVYVATLDATSVTLAWGKANGQLQNTIGHAAQSAGPATVQIAGRVLQTGQTWLRITGLSPDTVYPYSCSVGGKIAGEGVIRTWPQKADALTFIVMGDWGNGSRHQYAIAQRLEAERLARDKTDQPVRFVMSTGDNIYAGGTADRDWDRKFFAPYEATLRAIPFYAVPGNHDGNESEGTGDLATYLDNFFFPDGNPARWYSFTFGKFVELFALDSTRNQLTGSRAPVFLSDGEQSKWLKAALAKPGPPWRIAVTHHPPFTAGPDHPPALPALRHWMQAWQDNGVSVVFSGHEHNFQISQRTSATGGMQFVVSGAGGELRSGNVRSKMAQRHIAAWARQTHFTVVEIRGDTMRLTPIGESAMRVVDASGQAVPMPWIVPRRIR